MRGKRNDGAVSEASTFAERRRCCKLLAELGNPEETVNLFLQAAITDRMSAKSANNMLICFIIPVELRRQVAGRFRVDAVTRACG